MHFQGVPGKEIKNKGSSGGWKTFARAEDVAMVCTTVLFTCTVQHAAVNFPQYNEYAFPPNYPSVLNGSPPRDKVFLKILVFSNFHLHTSIL